MAGGSGGATHRALESTGTSGAEHRVIPRNKDNGDDTGPLHRISVF